MARGGETWMRPVGLPPSRVLQRGLRAERINRADKTVTCVDGSVLAYDTLILATGARARTLDAPIASARQ